MAYADLSQIKGAPTGYSGPPQRAYEKDPDTKYYNDERAGIDYYEYNGLKGLTKEAYDSRVAAQSKSQEFKDKIIADIRARQAAEKEPPTITTDPPATTPPPKEVPGPGTTPPPPPSSGGGGGGKRPKNKAKPISDKVIEDIIKNGGKYVDNSLSARDINQSIGKVGDINTNIVDSNFGDNAVIGNDQSETSGEQNVGNNYDEYELNLPKGVSGGGGEFINNGLSARDINQNIGKVGDINTNVEGSTFGDGAVIGNDYSQTSGTQNVGNTYTSRQEGRSQAKQKAKMFSKGGMFGEGGIFGDGGLRFS